MKQLLIALLCVACGGDDDADSLGIGAQCAATDECNTDLNQVCLAQFKGGYCGLQGCLSDLDCPDNAACVTPGDGSNYCFRTCVDKLDCNANRNVDNEANCSSSITFIDGAQGRKACVPPSG